MATSKKDVVPESVRKAEGSALRELVDASQFNQVTVAQASGVGSKAFVWQLMQGLRPLNRVFPRQSVGRNTRPA